MKIETKVNSFLNNYPKIKKPIKKTYQFIMYCLSKKIKSEGNIYKISPNDNMEYFFGYYDKSPWSFDDRYMLCIRAKSTFKSVAPKESAEILLIDTLNENSYEIIAKTNSWNVQQGCMLQWLGPDFNTRIIFNDFRNGKYCSIILNIKTKKEKVIDFPIYSVADDGKTALSLDFSRLHRMRKGYGYSNIEDETKDLKCPNSTAIWKIDLEKNTVEALLSYKDFYNFEFRKEMEGAEHKVNHIMISPNGKRFMVLHRWYKGERKYTRLITADINGKKLFNLSDENMTSHCYWKNNKEIIAFLHKFKEGDGYFILEDQSKKYLHILTDIKNDGHPSFSPNKNLLVIDSYPNRARIANIKIIDKNFNQKIVAKVFAPFKYDNDVRCDLHPRWNRKGDIICFDSVFEGRRGLYIVKLGEI